MTQVILAFLLAFQTHSFSGTYSSYSRKLVFLENNKCTLTVPTAWGYEEQRFHWRATNENTIELTKVGITKYTFQKIQYAGKTYLVEVQHLSTFQSYLYTVEERKTNHSDQLNDEEYLFAKARIDETLSKQ